MADLQVVGMDWSGCITNCITILYTEMSVGCQKEMDENQKPWFKNWIGLRSGESEKVGL
jgi:hypothetical protein